MSAASGKELRLVVVGAGASDPSSTAMLADRLAARTVAVARSHGAEIAVTTIELRTMANEIATALVSQNLGPKLTAAVAALGGADGVIARRRRSTRRASAASSRASSTSSTTTS